MGPVTQGSARTGEQGTTTLLAWVLHLTTDCGWGQWDTERTTARWKKRPAATSQGSACGSGRCYSQEWAEEGEPPALPWLCSLRSPSLLPTAQVGHKGTWPGCCGVCTQAQQAGKGSAAARFGSSELSHWLCCLSWLSLTFLNPDLNPLSPKPCWLPESPYGLVQ